LTRQSLLSQLGAFPAPAATILVKDQDVDDIISGIVKKHKECTSYYDRIYGAFNIPGSWWDVGQRLWEFCKNEIEYRIESVKWQWVSSPQSILKNGHCDCKGYALFIAGMLDAMKRAGEDIDWCYRFASYQILNSTPGHVFVVINPGQGSDEIWIDPVLDSYDLKFPRPVWKTDEYVTTSRPKAMVGFIPGTAPLFGTKLRTIGLSNSEQSLLDSINEYVEGVNNGIQTAVASQTINTICTVVLATASVYIPVIAAVWAAVKLGSLAVNDVFGSGSEAGMLMADIAENPILAPGLMLNTLIDGRTYESDQYRAAQFYQWYVKSNSKDNALNKTPDSDVVEALQWFCDRLGVFISGAEHIQALATSPGAYLALYSVNNYTTQDQNRVNAAYNVASKYFVFNNVLGSWANTVGVYDMLICEIANQQGETVEAAAAQANYQDVYSTAATTGPAPVTQTEGSPASGFPVIPALLAAAAVVFLLPSSKVK
jgi:hypothetical protein